MNNTIYIKSRKLKDIVIGNNIVKKIFVGKKQVWSSDTENVVLILYAGIGGSVFGSGIYQINSEVSISAIRDNGYIFKNWSDGSTAAERTITLKNNLSLSAYFNEYTGTLNYKENY